MFRLPIGRRYPAVAVALFALVLLVPGANAADSDLAGSKALRSRVGVENVRDHQKAFQRIANRNDGNRFAGLGGHDDSAEYVFNKLSDAGFDPWYQEFSYDACFEQSPSAFAQIAPNPTTYVDQTDFDTMTCSGSGDVTAQLSKPSGDNRGCDAADWTGFPAGNIALVLRGTPAGFPVACTFRLKAENAIAAGATAVIVYNNIPGLLLGTLGTSGVTRPVLGVTQALGQQLDAMIAGGVTLHVLTDTFSQILSTRNVFAEIPGQSERVVLLGAHLDSVIAGPGINDNGSGSAGILEVALKMKRMDKYSNPENTMRFAWWSAEESNLIGSNAYVAAISQEEFDRIALNLNFDMIGSPNYVRFVYDGDNSSFPAGVDGVTAGPPGSGEIEQLFRDYFSSQGLPSAATPFNGRSDYGPFIANGIPAGGLFTGAEGIKTAEQAAIYGGTAGIQYDPCYHQACDTKANNSNTILHQNADAIAHMAHIFALRDLDADPLVNPTATLNAVGSGGGGGMHADQAVDR